MQTQYRLSLALTVNRLGQRPALRQWLARIRRWAERALEKVAEGG